MLFVGDLSKLGGLDAENSDLMKQLEGMEPEKLQEMSKDALSAVRRRDQLN